MYEAKRLLLLCGSSFFAILGYIINFLNVSKRNNKHEEILVYSSI